MKESLAGEIQKEKDEYVKMLDEQEKLIKTNVNHRVFATIEEVQAIKEKENKISDEISRKEINIQYANLKPGMSI